MEYREKYILNTNKLMQDFLESHCRYEVVVRGRRLFITDKKFNTDIIEMRYDETNKAEIQAKIEGICASLNNDEILIR